MLLTYDKSRTSVQIDIWAKIVKSSDMSEIKRGKILTAARSVFLRHGFKRVSMSDIAEAADVSRAALYLLFRNKEDVFVGVLMQWFDETLSAITHEMAGVEAPEQKLRRAFELWTVRPFELMRDSPEARELVDCGFAFANDALRRCYASFETAITPAVASLAERHPAKVHVSPEDVARLLASATRGFKQTAADAADMRLLIEQLLMLVFRLDGARHLARHADHGVGRDGGRADSTREHRIARPGGGRVRKHDVAD